MESPVVLDKPPEYHGSDVNRGFPFEDEEASGAWSELAARHPDIAARLRQRPASATWARKRRPSNQDASDDYDENFGSFDRFPFDDIPPEFREHFPSHWNRGFGSREEPAPPPPAPAPGPGPSPAGAAQSLPVSPPHSAAAQPEPEPEPADTDPAQNPLPQYGLRNTVDLGQKSPADPSLVDAEDRTHRSMSAPPAARPPAPDMSSQRPEPPPRADPPHAPSNVRVIPIHVEGRDEPVVHRAEPRHKPTSAPHIDREQYFAEDAAPSFHHPPHFPRAFGTPSTKPFRQGSQPFTQQKVYPQRAQSPKQSQPPPPPEEHFVKVPVQHEHAKAPPAQPPPAPAPPRDRTPPPKPVANDPITQILSIQTDVLNLMNEVENFKGTKKDKRYIFLDEMLTRNLIKLDNIETEGKENIRLARREAIKCIQKCIAVLEAKAEKNGKPEEPVVEGIPDVDMKEQTENGDVEMEKEGSPPAEQIASSQAIGEEAAPPAEAQSPAAQAAAPPPEEPNPSELQPAEPIKQVQAKQSPNKKVVKKRDKSKDKAPADSVEAAKDSIKAEENVELMQVVNKGDETEQVMDADGAASQ